MTLDCKSLLLSHHDAGNDGFRYRAREYDTDPGPRDPFTGGGAAMIGNIGDIMMNIVDLPHEIKRTLTVEPGTRTRAPRKSSISNGSAILAQRNTEEARSGESELERSSTQQKLREPPTSSGEQQESTINSEASQETISLSTSTASRRLSIKEVAGSAEKFSLDTAISTGKAAGKIINLGMRAPTIFTMAVARGFHNAPLLYGDETVRETHRVTGIKSGLMAATKVRLQNFSCS